MNLFEDTTPKPLKQLLGEIDACEAALPDFQRDFVWEPSATQELIVSIASNYPAGSLLRIRNTHQLFAHREFEGAPKLNSYMPTYLVLDGQQRLTSLYQAFYGVGDHLYYLALDELLAGRDFEEAIFYLRANTKVAWDYRSAEIQAKKRILPLSVLKKGIGGFYDWTWMVGERIADSEERTARMQALKNLADQWIKPIDDYIFPVVTLTDKTGADAVCTIFETLNRTGVKLSVFELLTARFWPKGINLRDLWAKAKDDEPIIADFEIDPYYLLQTISLVARTSPSCKRSDVLELKTDAIQQWWDRAIWGLAQALKILQEDCGVITAKWLPYTTIINPFAAVLTKVGTSSSPHAGAYRHKLTRWFWCSVFGQKYEVAPNSQSAKDVTELMHWLDGGEPPETVKQFNFDPRVLREATPRQRSLYRGVIALILSGGPRDFYNGARLTSNLLVEHTVDDHHIFPQAYLTKRGITDTKLRDCVLNRTLIDRQTNIHITDHAPSLYLEVIKGALGAVQFQELLHSHRLPSGTDSPLIYDDFESFLTWRQEIIWKEIQRVTGATEPADLVNEGPNP